jgi:hypothetical protein
VSSLCCHPVRNTRPIDIWLSFSTRLGRPPRGQPLPGPDLGPALIAGDPAYGASVPCLLPADDQAEVLFDGQVSPFPDRDPPGDNQAYAEPRTRLADPVAASVAAPAAAPVVAPVAAPVAEPTPAHSPHPRAVNFRRGFTEEHQMCSDVTSKGKLAADFCLLKAELSTIREYHTLDYRPSWVQSSHFCQGGGILPGSNRALLGRSLGFTVARTPHCLS